MVVGQKVPSRWNIVIGTKYGVYVNLHLTADVFLFHHINIGGYMVFGSIVGSDYYVQYIICPPVNIGEHSNQN